MRQAMLDWVERLLSADAIHAAVQDGWPEKMVRAGFKLHQYTWDVDAIVADVRRNSSLPVDSVAHIWPALPGSGVTPVLYAAAAGVPNQMVRASSRLQHFTRYAVESAPFLELAQDGWTNADVVVVSGSDETVNAVSAEVLETTRVVGYGHRVSLAIVESGQDVAREVAHDIVMWHQQGCFSVRALVFIGRENEATEFARELAAEIARWEGAWDTQPTPAMATIRHQARGTAELLTEVFGSGFGFTCLGTGSVSADAPAPHSVRVFPMNSFEEALNAISIPQAQRQGVSLSCEETHRTNCSERLIETGFTLVCRAGELQKPPATWPHDGRPNSDVYAKA